jgi:hypothetical protein
MEAGKSSFILESGGDVAAGVARDLVISDKAEAALVRKQDLRVLPMVFLMYFFTFLGMLHTPRTNKSSSMVKVHS